MPVRAQVAGAFAVATLAATSCSSGGDDADAATTDTALFDSLKVHEIEVTFDQDDYDAMVEAYADDGSKEWIESTVTIDGETYEQVGLRLKGNSSLAGLGGGGFGGRGPGGPEGQDPAPDQQDADDATGESTTTTADDTEPTTTTTAADDDAGADEADEADDTGDDAPEGGFGPSQASADSPETLPWLIRLDEFVEGQDHQGYEDIVVRSNSSATSLNEAVSLDLLTAAGLASEKAVSTSFRVNDGDPVLRLAIEHPDDDAWQESNFENEGGLYKAESTGDWSYRGDDPADYEEVFDQEGGSDVTDLAPLIEFLRFLDESDDATFASELPVRLDVDAFATYLAMMDLLANFDDIDGPGNNAYLFYDLETEQFTVVPWDMNLALGTGFGGGPGGGEGGPGGFDPEQLPEGVELPEGFEPPTDGQMPGGDGEDGGPGGRSNPLVERFHANADFEALYQEKLTELRETLYASGVADEALAVRVDTLTENAGDLVDEATVTEEAEAISDQFSAD
jgi:spore coat protein CotH